MKRLAAALLALFFATAAGAVTDHGDVFRFKKGLRFLEQTAPGNPPANNGALYVADATGTTTLYFLDSAGTATNLLTVSSGNTLNGAYDQGGAGAGRTITASDGAVTITTTDADAAYMLALTPTPSGSAATGGLQITSGANSTQDSINVVNSGTGNDIDAGNGAFTVDSTGAVAALSLTATTLYNQAIAAAAAGNVNLTVDASGNGTITLGGTSTGKIVTDNLVEIDGHMDIGDAAADTLTITSVIDGNVTLDDGVTASPSLIFTDATDETATFSKADAGVLSLTTDATDGLNVLTGNLWVGNGSPGTASMDGEDGYVEGEFEVDGAVQLDGAVAIAGITTHTENIVQTTGADEYVQIDADTSANTGTAGVLDVNVQTATNTHKGVTLTTQVEDGATLAYGFYGDVNDDTTGAEVFEVFHAVNSAGTNATTKAFVSAVTMDQGFVSDTGAASTAIVVDATTVLSTSTSGAVMDAAFRSLTTASQAINLDVEFDAAGGAGETAAGIHIQLDDDANSADDVLTGIEIDTDANGTGLQHAIVVKDSAGWDAGLFLEGGYLRVGTGSTPDQALGTGDTAFIEGTVEVDGNLYADGAIIGDGATVMSGVLLDTEAVTATNALTAAECGGVFFLNSATEFATTLPAISTVPSGCWFEFYVAAAPSGASYTIITGNSLENVLYGGFVEREVDTGDDGPYQAAGDTITSVNGVGVASDFVRLVSNGSVFYVTGVANADGGLTITQAD